MSKKFPLYLLIVLLCFCSCGSIGLAMAGADRETVDLEVYRQPQKNKTLVFVPMLHIGKPVFYEDVKKKLDSLRSEGFVIFYENVKFDRKKYSREELDTLNRKIRKLLGFYFTNYKDSTNLSLSKSFFNDKYVLQTKARTGITEKDLKVDLPLDRLVQLYEKEFGKIMLAPCDFDTPLKAEYNCKTLSSEYVRHTARNEFILKQIRKAPYKKIALVYGKSHFRFFQAVLSEQEGFVEID